MKELSIEEKVKRYDEAVNEIKDLRDMLLKEGIINKNGIICNNFNRIFPELKEGEDEKIRKAIIEFFELQDDNTTYSLVPKKDIITWLEQQGEHKDILEDATLDNNEDGLIADTIKAKCEQKSAEWSEEDEDVIRTIINLVESTPTSDLFFCTTKKRCINWLKSLRPQSHWKPSDEHMENLSRASNGGVYRTSLLMELYQYLKKLKG